MPHPSLLQTELKQTRPFRSRVEEAVVGLFRTADVVRREQGAVVEARGITLQQYNVLRILRGAGAEGLPTLDIAGRMVEQAPGVTRLLDRLVAKHLVRRERCLVDRRQVLCWIEPAGTELLSALQSPMRAAARRRLGALGPRGLESLITLMEAVRTESSDPSRTKTKTRRRKS